MMSLCSQHVSRLPEALKIFLCWPKAWVDNAYTDELTTPNTRERTTETSTSTQAQGASAVTSKTAQPSESSVHQVSSRGMLPCMGVLRQVHTCVLVRHAHSAPKRPHQHCLVLRSTQARTDGCPAINGLAGMQ